MKAIFRKELVDYFTSARVLILLILVLLTSLLALYSAQSIERIADTEFAFTKLFITIPDNVPELFTFLEFTALFFIPIIGIALGFDAINSEHSGRTLSRILSQPVFRDNVINAKFLAGITTLSIMVLTSVLLVAGAGLGFRVTAAPIITTLNAVWHLGLSVPVAVPLPILEEVFRFFLYIVFAIVYGAFWLGLAILFSVLFRRVSTSLLVSVGLWLVLGIFLLIIAQPIASAIAPVPEGDTAAYLHNYEVYRTILRFSPNFLFLEASDVLLQPPLAGSVLGAIGVWTAGVQSWMVANPLSLGQSMILVWPHLTFLVCITLVCFAISYVVFMRQEIRST